MRSKDILARLNSEVDRVMPEASLSNITRTPINVECNSVSSGGVATATMTHTSFVKTRAFKALCVIAVIIALIVGIVVPVVLTSGGNGGIVAPVVGSFSGSTYLSMDINPSVDFVVDNKNVVRNVVSRNNDADVLLSNGFKESLISKDINEAINMTLDQATRLGYIDASNGGTAPSAVRISVAGDSSESANNVLNSVKASATDHLKSSGIYMVVVGREVDKSVVLGNSGIASIDKWNEVNESKETFHYINNVVGKNKQEVIEEYKRDFVSHYVADAFEELFEDLEDIMELMEDIEHLEDEIREIEREENLIIRRDYWGYKEQIKAGKTDNIPSDIIDKVASIDSKIEEYNKIILNSDDEGDIIVLSKIFKLIDNDRVYYDYLRHKLNLIKIDKVKADIEDFIDKVEENIANLDLLLDKVNNIFGALFDGVEEITSGIKADIDREIAKVTSEANDYFKVCTDRINASYDKLIKKNEANKGTGAITDEEYEQFVKDALEGFDDFDDFWESTHQKKSL